MKKQDFPIDFVVLWVDSSDKDWQKDFARYAPQNTQIVQTSKDAQIQRYRDYGLLKFWFRAVESFAPWVNKVHFVTSGQMPQWLNLRCKKLHCIKHSDYIPSECLPLFNSNPIELYMHKIQGLQEHFVLFNDDFFLTCPVKKDFFFKKGLPCDSAIQNIPPSNGHSIMHSIVLNDIYEVNKNFCKRKVIQKNFFKWYCLSYGKDNAKNLVLSLWKKYVGFINPHFPYPYLKSNIENCWQHCKDALQKTMHSRFRSEDDVNHWLFRYWHLCRGEFFPTAPYKKRKYFQLGDDNIDDICCAVEKGEYKTICINDGNDNDFEQTKKRLQESFGKLLPQKSSFEI